MTSSVAVGSRSFISALERYQGKIVSACGHESTQTNPAKSTSISPLTTPTTSAQIPKNRDR